MTSESHLRAADRQPEPNIARWPAQPDPRPGPPSPADALIALQCSAGNRAVAKLLRDPRSLLTPTAAASAVADVSRRYGEDSIRLFEEWSSRPRDGAFTVEDAEAFAHLQTDTLHVAPTGRADEATLTALLKLVGPTHWARNALIHIVVERAGLNLSGILGVEYDPHSATGGSLDTDAGGVGMIRLNNSAFAGYATMVAEIRRQLAVKPLGGVDKPLDGAVLSDRDKQEYALSIDRHVLHDRRSVRILQGAVYAKYTGEWDVSTVRHIAAMQHANGLTPSGILGEPTLALLVGDLIARGYHDGVLQLIVEYFRLDRSHAHNIAYNADGDPAQPAAMGKTLGAGHDTGIPSVVHIYPLAFQQPFARLVHAVAHELSHVDQTIAGISSPNVREFLSHGLEIESAGLPPESLESDEDIDREIRGEQPHMPGLLQHVNVMLYHWGRMTASEKAANHRRFVQLRAIVVRRIGEGTTSQQRKLAPLIPDMQRADEGVP
jgi:hypothetical protein